MRDLTKAGAHGCRWQLLGQIPPIWKHQPEIWLKNVDNDVDTGDTYDSNDDGNAKNIEDGDIGWTLGSKSEHYSFPPFPKTATQIQ